MLWSLLITDVLTSQSVKSLAPIFFFVSNPSKLQAFPASSFKAKVLTSVANGGALPFVFMSNRVNSSEMCLLLRFHFILCRYYDHDPVDELI